MLVSSDTSLPGTHGAGAPAAQPAGSRQHSSEQASRCCTDRRSAYEVTYPFKLGRAGTSGALRRNSRRGADRLAARPRSRRRCVRRRCWRWPRCWISVLLAALVSSISLAPLERISAQLDRISRGRIRPEAARGARRIRPGQHQDQPDRTAIARRARDFQHLAREPRSGSRRARGRAAAVHARRPRRDGQPRGGAISWACPPISCWAARAERIFPPGHPVRERCDLRNGRIRAGGRRRSGYSARSRTAGAARRRQRAGDHRRRHAHGRAGHIRATWNRSSASAGSCRFPSAWRRSGASPRAWRTK